MPANPSKLKIALDEIATFGLLVRVNLKQHELHGKHLIVLPRNICQLGDAKRGHQVGLRGTNSKTWALLAQSLSEFDARYLQPIGYIQVEALENYTIQAMNGQPTHSIKLIERDCGGCMFVFDRPNLRSPFYRHPISELAVA